MQSKSCVNCLLILWGCEKMEYSCQVAFRCITFMRWIIIINNTCHGNLIASVKAVLPFYFEKQMDTQSICLWRRVWDMDVKDGMTRRLILFMLRRNSAPAICKSSSINKELRYLKIENVREITKVVPSIYAKPTPNHRQFLRVEVSSQPP